MRNATIVNLFVLGDYLEYITSQLVDFPVVVKKINNQYRVQLTCEYAGIKSSNIEIFYYDQEEKDHFYRKLGFDMIIRMTIFARDITPYDYEDDNEQIKAAFKSGTTHADSNFSTENCVSVDNKTIYPRVL